MSDQPMVNLTIDGVPVSVPKGTLLVEAAKSVKQEIPVYCYHPKLGPAGLCRICLVEIEGQPKLQIACNTPVADGMVVHTQSEKVEDGARDDSRTAARQSSARLSDLRQGRRVRSARLRDGVRARHLRRRRPEVAQARRPSTSGRRSCSTKSAASSASAACASTTSSPANEQLVVKDRGAHDIIATATGDPYHHNFTGNVTEICPGRRADLEDLSLQVASVGPESHADDLHAVCGRLSDVRPTCATIRCCARCRSNTTTRSPTAGCATAAATTSASTRRPSG